MYCDMSAEGWIVKPAETATAREQLCKHPLLGDGARNISGDNSDVTQE
jgi:hypothetical protein